MANRLAHAMSPYLRSHADNPVDWWPWCDEAFAEARRRDVPVLISIGYATCHWCHVMARETFSDPEVAALLSERVVSIKVDREEHPGVDASYMAQAAAFTQGLGWPLTVFAAPTGEAFFAGTYFAPEPIGGRPSFTQVLDAVTDAWRNRRDQVEASAQAIGEAVRAAAQKRVQEQGRMPGPGALPGIEQITASARALAEHEDALFGGFGTAPKFPVAPTLSFLQHVEQDEGAVKNEGAVQNEDAVQNQSAAQNQSAVQDGAVQSDLAERTLAAMAASPLRDRDGGFFRYATGRDWSDPHYERMLYDNALLLRAYTQSWQRGGDSAAIAAGIAEFLGSTLFLGDGFASGQDSESVVDGARTEGGYYLADDRSALDPPPLDDKVLTGWNGLAVEALARAGTVFARPDWVDLARRAADGVLARHDVTDPEAERSAPVLRRASVRRDGRTVVSDAAATLEDYGMLACGLIELTCATGEAGYARRARELLTRVRTDDGYADPQDDPVLERRGLVLADDVNESATPSGLSACVRAERMLVEMGDLYASRSHAAAALVPVAAEGLDAPIGFGAVLEEALRLQRPSRQLVVVTADAAAEPIASEVRRRAASVVTVVGAEQAAALTASGFTLFEGRTPQQGRPTLYECVDGACRLPVTL